MFTFIEDRRKAKDTEDKFNLGDKIYINMIDDDKPAKTRSFTKRMNFQKANGFLNYKDFLRNNYPNFEIKEINEDLTYFQKIISSKYFYYIILYKLISWTVKGVILLYMFLHGLKAPGPDEDAPPVPAVPSEQPPEIGSVCRPSTVDDIDEEEEKELLKIYLSVMKTSRMP